MGHELLVSLYLDLIQFQSSDTIVDIEVKLLTLATSSYGLLVVLAVLCGWWEFQRNSRNEGKVDKICLDEEECQDGLYSRTKAHSKVQLWYKDEDAHKKGS